MSCNWNDQNVNDSVSSNWRASLVPAAAVIPAPRAYIKVVAVKKLVVGFLSNQSGPPAGWASGSDWASSWRTALHLIVWSSPHDLYLEEIRVFQAGLALNTLAWDNNEGYRLHLLAAGIDVMLKRNCCGSLYLTVRGEILKSLGDTQQRKPWPRKFSLIKNES